jgi:hypothetical protein
MHQSRSKYFKILMTSVFIGFLKKKTLQNWDTVFIFCPRVGSSKVSVRLTYADPFMNRDYRRLQVRNLFHYFSFHCISSCNTNLIKHLEFGVIKIKIIYLVRIILKWMAFYRTVCSEQESHSNRSINLQLQFLIHIYSNRFISLPATSHSCYICLNTSSAH